MGKRVLVLHESESVLSTTKVVLERAGYDVRTGATTRDLRGVLKESRPDLVLLDVNMPGLADDHARRNDLFEGVPVVLYSDISEEILADLAERRARAHVRKSNDYGPLLQKLAELAG